jgi:hypothetical protein
MTSQYTRRGAKEINLRKTASLVADESIGHKVNTDEQVPLASER